MAALALLAACSEPVTQPEPAASRGETASASPTTSQSPSATPSPPPAYLPEPETLAGEWKVVAIDGKDLNEPYALVLSASETEIWWSPLCAGMVRGYAIKGGAIRFGRAPSLGPPPPPGTPPPAVCAIGFPQSVADAIRALDAATTIRRSISNGIEISGGDHSLVLFSQ